MNGRRFIAFALLLALVAPLALFAGAGETCDDDCSAACGDCALCAGVAVAPANAPRLALPDGAAAAPAEETGTSGAPSRLPDPVPLALA